MHASRLGNDLEASARMAKMESFVFAWSIGILRVLPGGLGTTMSMVTGFGEEGMLGVCQDRIDRGGV